jgi:hypothetical protein
MSELALIVLLPLLLGTGLCLWAETARPRGAVA